MNKDELKKIILDSINDNGYGVNVYALAKENDKDKLKYLKTSPDFNLILKKIITTTLSDSYLKSDFTIKELDKYYSEDEDNFYEINLNETFNPVLYLNELPDEKDCYEIGKKKDLKGLFFRISRNGNTLFWMYQNKGSGTFVKKGKSVYARINGNVFEEEKEEIIKFEPKHDFIIVGNSIISKKIELLEESFDLPKYIRQQVSDKIEKIKNKNIIDDLTKIIDFNKTDLENSKNLLSINTDSVVFSYSPEELIRRIQNHDYYNKHITLNNDKIISGNTDPNELIKLFNDEIVDSTLTGNRYVSHIKKDIK